MASPCYYSATARSNDFASQAQAVRILESQNKLAWIPGIMYHCNIHNVQWLQHCCLMLQNTQTAETTRTIPNESRKTLEFCVLLLVQQNGVLNTSGKTIKLRPINFMKYDHSLDRPWHNSASDKVRHLNLYLKI